MDRGSILRVWLPLVVGSFVLGAAFKLGPGPHGVARWVGLVVSLVGFAGVIISRYTLGRSFSVAPKATALVTGGIYSRIRNPIYVSGVILIIGFAIMVWRLDALVILLVIIPMQTLRARKEAGVLEAKFGEEYRAYRQRTWF
jgi:protein-S-isoprenylcysteine O-methyltransferase Ste14